MSFHFIPTLGLLGNPIKRGESRHLDFKLETCQEGTPLMQAGFYCSTVEWHQLTSASEPINWSAFIPGNFTPYKKEKACIQKEGTRIYMSKNIPELGDEVSSRACQVLASTEELTRLHPWASRSTKFLMKPNGPMHAFASLDHDMS
eukprot:1151107-Pelagomonas_calceolata.AAC.4